MPGHETEQSRTTRGRATSWKAPDLVPAISYEDARAAIEWLERAFGFERHVVYESDDGAVEHAELRVGSGMVMLGSEREGEAHDRFRSVHHER